jgi:hypothetical protein
VRALPSDFVNQALLIKDDGIDPEDTEMVPFYDKQAEFKSRVKDLIIAHSGREPELCEEFQRHIESLSSALNTLQHVDVNAVCSELASLNSCISSWGLLYEEERMVFDPSHGASPQLGAMNPLSSTFLMCSAGH